MKFLQAVVLSAICVRYVTASYPSYFGSGGLCSAIDEGRLDIVVELNKQDETLGKKGIEYVIKKGNSDFIVNFVNQTNQANATTLFTLLSESPIETVEKVLDRVDFPRQVLVDMASSSAVMYRTEKFLVLLNKVVKPEDQEKVIEKRIKKLVYNDKVISPLLDALKGKTFRSERLEHFATQKAFMWGVKCGYPDRLPAGICNHVAITPELYADALIEAPAAVNAYDDDMCQFLLEQADLYDLETLKEKPGYASLDSGFRGVIEKALKTAALGGTRTRPYDIQTVEKAEETFAELGSSGISKDPLSIVGDFVALDASTRRESLVIQKTFIEGVRLDRQDYLPDNICEHAAITPELYADALIETAEKWKYTLHLSLLKNADCYDLQVVKEKAGYARLKPEFSCGIEKALKTAALGGTRTRPYDIQTVEKAEETFAELGSSGISKDPLSIVSDFVALDAPARREGQIAPKKATKKVASDVTSTPTTKTESSKIRKRKGGKGKGKGKGKKKGGK